MIAFLFSGISLNAQQLTTTSASTALDTELIKTYGENFVNKTTAATLAKQSISLLLSTPPATPAQEASRAVEQSFVSSFLDSVSDSTVLQALKAGLDGAQARKADFTLDVDVIAIYTKYYDLVTN